MFSVGLSDYRHSSVIAGSLDLLRLYVLDICLKTMMVGFSLIYMVEESSAKTMSLVIYLGVLFIGLLMILFAFGNQSVVYGLLGAALAVYSAYKAQSL